MRIAIISTFRHPTRLPLKERSVMQPSAPELVAAWCPADAEIEIYNEKENDVPLDRDWDLAFFSYLDPFYEHTKVLSTLLRQRGVTTVAGGRHASRHPRDCTRYFDAVVVGDPEGNVARLVDDFGHGELKPVYDAPAPPISELRPYRYDLLDCDTNRLRVSTVETSRGCPFTCNFCVLTGHEQYRYRPVRDVVRDIGAMKWNRSLLGLIRNTFMFYDNNLGGSPKHLRELCEAITPLKKTWGCALTFNILEDDELVRAMGRAGCRFIYTGLESLNPDSIDSMNKRQNRLRHLDRVIRNAYGQGIMLSFGLVVGADGDTNEYLERVPEYLGELGCYSITFLGIMCPYPGTPFYESVRREGRLLPGATVRDLDTYTVVHRPRQLDPSEVADHYQRLCREIATLPNVVRNCVGKFRLNNSFSYRAGMMIHSPEVLSIKNNLKNPARTYVAGRDPIESWDAEQMLALGIEPQRVGPAADDAVFAAAGC